MGDEIEEISALVDKAHAYCATDDKDFERRQALRLTDAEVTRLHQLAWLGVVPLEDYYELQDFRLADQLWLNPKEGTPSFRTIDQVRAWVRWKETHTQVTADGCEITETVYNRFFPVFRYIRRTISKRPNKALQQTISLLQEVEFADLHPSRNFDTSWTQLIGELQADAVEHFKWSVQDSLPPEQKEHLQQLVLLGKADVRLVYTLSQGSRKESKAYSLLEAYQPLLQNAMEEVTREQDKQNMQNDGDDFVHDTSAQQLEDILKIIRQAFLKWDPLRGPLPAWVQFKLDKETQGLVHKEYRLLEQQRGKRSSLTEAEISPDSVRGKRRSEGSFLPNIDPTQTPIPVPLAERDDPEEVLHAVKIAMRAVMIRELGESHYQRRFIDDISAIAFAKELGPSINRNAVAKREQRARNAAFIELSAKFGPRIGQYLFRN